MMAPWLLVGFFLAGVISILLPREYVVKAMGRSKGWRGVLNAVLIGIPLPICSCGVLPLTTGLREGGAGKGAVAGFLISTPQTGVDSILATYALMGPTFAIARPLAALMTGLLGGVAVNAITNDSVEQSSAMQNSTKCHHCCCKKEHKEESSQPNTIVRIFRTGYGELLGEIAFPLTIGLVISAIVTIWVPADFMVSILGNNDWMAMPIMVLIGFPMYVCSTAAIPIAASLMTKGLTPGAAFVFLMVGPAINAASLATVSKLIGRYATIVYAIIIAVGAIICGMGINLLPPELLKVMVRVSDSHEISLCNHVAAIILIACLGYHLIKKGLRKRDCCG